MKLSDNSIAQLVKVLQVAMLTGTDIVDNIRQITFKEEDGFLNMDQEYLENFDQNLETMMSTLSETEVS